MPQAEALATERDTALQHIRGLLQKTNDERAYYRNLSEAAGQTLAVPAASAVPVQVPLQEAIS